MDAETLVKAVLDEQLEITQLTGEQMESIILIMQSLLNKEKNTIVIGLIEKNKNLNLNYW
jgi:hypothetical protein